ncbi:MAG: hypothetical protein ACOYMN_17950, partial [Roseimicrobium sp.]
GMIRLLDNPIARDAAIQKVALRLALPEADYRRQVARTPKPQVASMEETPGKNPAQGAPLPPQDRNAMLLCRYTLADAAVMHWLRATERQGICRDVPGCELLALIWQTKAELTEPAALNAFISTLSREEESAFSRMLSQPMPEGGLTEAQVALAKLEAQRLKHLVERVQTQLKQPGLPPQTIAQLNQELLALRHERDGKESLDRFAASQKFSILRPP